MTPLSDFRSRIATRVLTAVDLTIDQAVLDTCIDFCEKTLIVKSTLGAFNTVAGLAEYDIDSPAQQNVCKIMQVFCGLRELSPTAEDDVNTPFGYAVTVGSDAAPQAKPTAFHEPSPGVISLYPVPDAAYTITMRVASKPRRSASTVEDVLYENWVDEIVNGSLARMYAMPGMPFTNPQFASAHQGMYVAGRNRALIEATRGRTRAEQRIRPVHI